MLARLGVDAADVRDVVLTHLHYDHSGHLAAFPRARFWVQDDELAFWTGRHAGRGAIGLEPPSSPRLDFDGAFVAATRSSRRLAAPRGARGPHGEHRLTLRTEDVAGNAGTRTTTVRVRGFERLCEPGAAPPARSGGAALVRD